MDRRRQGHDDSGCSGIFEPTSALWSPRQLLQRETGYLAAADRDYSRHQRKEQIGEDHPPMAAAKRLARDVHWVIFTIVNIRICIDVHPSTLQRVVLGFGSVQILRWKRAHMSETTVYS